MSLPEYPYLRELKVSGQNLHLLAPLLSRLCNLESFEMLQSRNGDDLLEHFLPATLQAFNSVDISNKSIECLVVQDVLDTSLGHLAKVIGGSVKEVHVKILVNSIAHGDSETISALSGFAGLRRLRVDGSTFDKECLLDLQSSLEAFTFSEDISSMRTMLTLLYANWQPSLQSLDVYRMPMSIYYSEEWIAAVAEYRDELHSAGVLYIHLPSKENNQSLFTGHWLWKDVDCDFKDEIWSGMQLSKVFGAHSSSVRATA
ncbi:hypothetical protein BD769DRAFT_1388447 [Suillus cothurnatus]|nr:hypothetical protein BD769DRAFT_1388447 [Suillus cothurnatus]